MTIWRMRIAFLTSKAKNTRSEYVIPTAFPLQQLLKEHTSILRYYVHCMSCLSQNMAV
jgi:hypothetical protein